MAAQTNANLDSCRAELKSTFEVPASLVKTNEGIATASKLIGSIYFTVSSVAVPILEEPPVEIPATPTQVSAPSTESIEPSDSEEARLMKHVGKNQTTGFKPQTQQASLTPKIVSSPQVLVKPSVELTAPVVLSPVKIESDAAVSTPSKPGMQFAAKGTTDGDSKNIDPEEARIMKHLFAKGAAPTRGQFARVGTGGASSAPTTPTTKIGAPGATSAGTPTALPTWKVKQMERENLERERREQERLRIQAILEKQQANAASTPTSVEVRSDNVSVGAGASTGESDTAQGGFVSDADAEMRLKKEEDRLLKLMSGGGKGISKQGGIKF